MDSIAQDIPYLLLLKKELQPESNRERLRFAEWLLSRQEKYPHPTAASPDEEHLWLFPEEFTFRSRLLKHWKVLKPRPATVSRNANNVIVIQAGTWQWQVSADIVKKLSARWQGNDNRDVDIAAVYMRYLLIGGVGQQAAIPPSTWQELRSIGCQTEAFASAINATMPNFCTAFPQLEAPFGGRCAFEQLPLQGVVECNPPFVTHAVNVVGKRCLEAITTDVDLTLVLILPNWDDWKYYKEIAEHPCLVVNRIVPSKSHCYMDVRTGQIRVAVEDSRLMILQTACATRLPEGWVDRFLAAWAPSL